MNNLYNCIIILGPTAVGKTSLGVAIADKLNGEIISADSRQVYKELNIGSGKDLCEFTLDKDTVPRTIPYHLIDVASLDEEYSVFRYQTDFYKAFSALLSRSVLPVIVGGTGMYLDSIVRNYKLAEVPANPILREQLNKLTTEELAKKLLAIKPELHNSTDLTERHRIIRAIEIEEGSNKKNATNNAELPCPEVKALIIGTTFPRDYLRQRINKRLKERFDSGMIDEVSNLHKNGTSWERLERLGLEYRFISEYLEGKINSFEELYTLLGIAIGQFAKRQETWFRGMERKGVKINWLKADPNFANKRITEALEIINNNMY